MCVIFCSRMFFKFSFSDADRIIQLGASVGTVEITLQWTSTDLANARREILRAVEDAMEGRVRIPLCQHFNYVIYMEELGNVFYRMLRSNVITTRTLVRLFQK